MRGRLTYSNVVATIALFLSLGLGGAYAASKIKSKDIAKSAVTSKAIKDGTITGKDVKDGGLAGADLAESSIGTSKIADGAIDASKISDGSIGASKIAADSIGANEISTGGVGTSEIADGSVGAADLSAPESYRVIGASGQPSFGNGGDGDCIWSNGAATGGGNPPSFYRDSEGRVHLAGVLTGTNGAGGDGVCDASSIPELFEDFRAFTLPVGYRPANPEQITTTTTSNAALSMVIGADHSANLGGVPVPPGEVFVSMPTFGPVSVTLDGLDFRAAPTP